MLRSNIEHVFDKRGISEFDKVEMENDSMDDDRNVLTESSDLQLFSGHEFSSDTDNDDDTQQQLSMEPDSQQTEANSDDIWSYDLHPLDIAPFTEQ